MDLVELTFFLVKSLVSDQSSVTVKKFEDDNDYITIQVIVNEEDMGAVIGHGGAIANAIRTIVQAASYANNLPKVKINIDSIYEFILHFFLYISSIYNIIKYIGWWI